MTNYAWTPGAGAYKFFPQYVNVTAGKLTVRGPEFQGDDGHWRMGPTVTIELPPEVRSELSRALAVCTYCRWVYGHEPRCPHRKQS